MEKETRVYTAYHFYLSLLLKYLLRDHGYEVEPLVKVGSLPLEVDIIIIKRHPKKRRKEFTQLDFLFRLLVDFNLIEFKGPTDTLLWQDYLHLIAMAELYRIKISHPAKNDVRLFTIASTIPKDYHKFLKMNRLKLSQQMDGLYAVSGAIIYDHYILVLNELEPDQKNELILFFSSKYHDRMGKIISYQENLITLFLIQELYQKEREKMKFKIKDEDLVVRDLEEAIRRLPLELRLAGLKPSEILKILNPGEILKVLSPEERLEGLKPEQRLEGLKPEERLEGLKPKERLVGLKPEERLEGLKPEERLKGLKTEELKRLKEILDKLNLN